MLPVANRLRRSAEFTDVVRRGRRSGAPGVVVYAVTDPGPADVRVGFIVGRNVGNAVSRNAVRRRLRHLAAQRLREVPGGTRLVIRATPGAARRSFAALGAAVDEALAGISGTGSGRSPA